MARRTILFSSVVLLAIVSTLAEEEYMSEDMSFVEDVEIIDDVDFDLEMSSGRGKRGAEYGNQAGFYGNSGYHYCGNVEGYPGICKPLATCAHYYGSPQRYGQGYSNYKSCTFGYGYHGVCCPEVIYSGWKPAIINYHPKKYGHAYESKYSAVTAVAIKEAVKYCEDHVNKYYESDNKHGRDENHPSYWGNGVAQEHYVAEFHDYAYTGYFQICLTDYLQKHYGYAPQSYYEGGLHVLEYSQYLPAKYLKVCQSYYRKCYPSKYRSIEGYCNNLKHPYWGASNTAMGRILLPSYGDNIHQIRYGVNGHSLPNPRYIRTHALPNKNVEEKNINSLYVNFGQFIVHDVTHSTFYQAHNGLFIDCCDGYQGGDHHISPKCYALPLPHDDIFYKQHGQSCLNFARSIVGPNQDCRLGYSSPLNRQTAAIDSSLIYGNDYNTSHSLRTHSYGLMKMSKVGSEYYLVLSDDSECFVGAGKFCMKSGDFRTTMHPGMTGMEILFVRFHNLCAKQMHYLNPYWSDERLYQECRRIVIAVTQHIVYMEYAPLLLGWKFMHDYGLLSVTKGYSWDYSDKIIPWTITEVAGAAMRHHSMVYGKIALVNEYYQPEKILHLEHWYNNDKVYENPHNFNSLIRGYMWATKRKMDVYYDPAMTDFLLMDPSKTKFGLDIASFNIQRGRDNGIAGYNYFREICGLKKAYKWEDYHDTIAPYIVAEFKKIYNHYDDLDLYVGGIAETAVQDSLMGPVFWCLLGNQYQHWKWGDRYFYTLGGQRHSFSLPQLHEIQKMSMAGLICMTTTIKHVPAMAFRTYNNYSNPLVSCSDHYQIPRINFAAFSGKY